MFFTDFERVVNIFDTAISISLLIFAILSFYYILYFFNSFKKTKPFEKGKINYKFLILVPARDEHEVIENCLKALKNQDYPSDKFDVFAITESKDDPTNKLAKKYGFNSFIRKDLVNKRTKGYAIRECLNYLNSQNYEYDAVVIFDADNVMEKNYISLLNDVKNAGYEVGLGYRSFTNAETNWVSACSATLFAFMNQFTSKGRSRYLKKATLTGTGYYIDKKIIDDAGGWIWCGMTEDVELTSYCYYHSIQMHYYPLAIYYDEQPTSKKVLHKQHVRWVYGFVGNKDKFKKKEPQYHPENKFRNRIGIIEYNMSIWPFATFIITQILASIAMIILLIISIVEYCRGIATFEEVRWVPWHLLYNLVLLYFSFVLVALISLFLDRKNLKFKFKTKVKVLFSYAFFFFDFVLAFIDGFLHKSKRTNWSKIEHDGKINNVRALEIQNEEEKNNIL